MEHLFLHSERVSPTGNVTSEGIINQLGRPKLGLLETLVREAVQNSWDAKDPISSEPVTFGMVGWTLNKKQREVLQKRIFKNCPSNSYLPLLSYLQSTKKLAALAVYDRGTVGLGGPTRADISNSSDGPRDFVDFLRNVGQPPDKKLAGGTYGFGKAAFYRASRARTILIHTRCLYNGKMESRFIAAALGKPFVENGIRYTGRHWWGKENPKLEISDPIEGQFADALADFLNMPPFREGERGTTIVVLQPSLSEEDEDNQPRLIDIERGRSPKQALNQIAEYLLWYFWPKMLTYNGSNPAMRFVVSWEGEQILIPDPTKYPPLYGFVDAIQRLKASKSDDGSPLRHQVTDISSQRPKQHLGRLALQQFFTSQELKFDTGREPLFNNLTHHTALMRMPELVVKYLPGDSMPNEQFGYAGVFITDQEVDSVFADSEPPTHDEWVSKSLKDNWHKRYVNAALRGIDQAMNSFAKPSGVKSNGSPLMPLGTFSNKLGSTLLPSEIGSAAVARVFQKQPPPDKALKSSTSSTSPYKPFEPGQDEATSASSQSGMDFSGDKESEYISTEPTETLLPTPAFADVPSSDAVPTNNAPHSDATANDQPKRPSIIGRSRVRLLDEGDFVLVNGMPALQLQFSVSHAKNADGTLIHTKLRAVIDGGSTETEPPIGGSTSKVLRWINPDGEVYAGNDALYISSDIEGDWFIVVSMPEDIVLNVDLTAEAKQKS